MAPRGRPTRLNPDTTPTPVTPAPNAPTTTTVTKAQLQALINQGVAAAMAEAEASRVRNDYNSNALASFSGSVINSSFPIPLLVFPSQQMVIANKEKEE
ncbi:hypothetical protein Tco_0115194 [Tanacetum coccineum]